jgi:hypothetical protein
MHKYKSLLISVNYCAYRRICIPVGLDDIWEDIQHSHPDVGPSLFIEIPFQQWIEFAEPQWACWNDGSCQVVHQSQNWWLLQNRVWIIVLYRWVDGSL